MITYAEMDSKIVSLLELCGVLHELYTAQRIKNLETTVGKLLEACKEALKEFNGMGYVPEKAIPMLEQAIAKAEGK